MCQLNPKMDRWASLSMQLLSIIIFLIFCIDIGIDIECVRSFKFQYLPSSFSKEDCYFNTKPLTPYCYTTTIQSRNVIICIGKNEK